MRSRSRGLVGGPAVSWSPEQLTPKIFFDAGYVEAVGTGTWTARYNAATVAATLTESTSEPDTAAGGYPDFERANSDRLTGVDITGNPLTDFVGLGACTTLTVLDVESIADKGVEIYHSDPIVTDKSGYHGLHLANIAGTPKGIFWQYDGAVKSVTVTVGASGRVVLAAKKVGGALKITANGTDWTTGDACGNLDAGASTAIPLWVGSSFYAAGKSYDGIIRALVLDSVAWSDADVLSFYAWAAARYP